MHNMGLLLLIHTFELVSLTINLLKFQDLHMLIYNGKPRHWLEAWQVIFLATSSRLVHCFLNGVQSTRRNWYTYVCNATLDSLTVSDIIITYSMTRFDQRKH